MMWLWVGKDKVSSWVKNLLKLFLWRKIHWSNNMSNNCYLCVLMSVHSSWFSSRVLQLHCAVPYDSFIHIQLIAQLLQLDISCVDMPLAFCFMCCREDHFPFCWSGSVRCLSFDVQWGSEVRFVKMLLLVGIFCMPLLWSLLLLWTWKDSVSSLVGNVNKGYGTSVLF